MTIMGQKYNHLFQPLKVKGMIIKNRIAMMPLATNMAGHNGELTDAHIHYYEERAKGGTGYIIVENCCVSSPEGDNGPTQLRIDHDRYVPKMSELVEKLHKYGTAVCCQINHAGASSDPKRTGMPCVSSSDQPAKHGGVTPRMIPPEDMPKIAQKYADAAKRCVTAGFDCVDVHCGHAYLLSQFLSPIYNTRKDEYGGSIENRVRFPLMVVKAVREAVGPDYPLEMRLTADDMMEGGNTLEDMLKILEYFVDYFDIINVSVAIGDSTIYQLDNMSFPDGWRAYMAKAVKEKFGKPVIAQGNMRHPKVAERLLQEGYADMIGIGRGLVAEPQWVNKVKSGNEDMLRLCISCNIGCAANRINGVHPIHCTVNPDIVYEDAYKKQRVNRHTNVVVVGGGTAGLEAACTAAEVGCTVFLLEKSCSVGGLASIISRYPGKSRISDFTKYLKARADSLENLYILTETAADEKILEALKPDLLVNATGSIPLRPPIPGLADNIDVEGGNVYSILNLLDHLERFQEVENKKILIAGGGAVGMDTMEFFSQNGAEVTLVEMMDEVGRDQDPMTKAFMNMLIEKHNVDIRTNCKVLEVHEDHFVVDDNGIQKSIFFDIAAMCLGMQSTGLDKTIEQFCLDRDITLYNIGDSKKARKIINGVEEGRNILTMLSQEGRL